MRPDPAATPIDMAVLEQAADWLLRLSSGKATAADRAACERWRDSHPEHARAWASAERLRGLLDRVPKELALEALDRPARPRRRDAVKRLALLAAAVPGGWFAWQAWRDGRGGADLHTAVGERRQLDLPDGSRLLLNTASAVDIDFAANERRLHLRAGELLVDTAPDPQSPARPFRVSTVHGTLQALGTRFGVRVDSGRTRIAVLDGAVRMNPAGGGVSGHVRAGEQTWFDAHTIGPTTAADERIVAWQHGMLAADRLPLGELLAELGRHRRGLLRCDPEVATLPVSGAFPVDDTDRSLAMLEATWPVRVRHIAGGWVTTVGPARLSRTGAGGD